MRPISTRARWYIGGAVALALLLGFAIAFAYSTWSEVNRVAIERPGGEATAAPASQEEKDSRPSESAEEDDEPGVAATSVGTDIYLLVGSDSRADLSNLEGFGEFEGNRADVVMVFLRTDSEAAVLSLPRDLYVDDVCTGGQARLNNMLEVCGA
jgi:anionic cell wall polymer biosynthesis LytR-Cps2A-Psr (LCP) family protein